MEFREYYNEVLGTALGAGAGWVLGGGTPLSWPLAMVGGYAGHQAEKWAKGAYNYGTGWWQKRPKADPNWFTYYRDMDGKAYKQLLPHPYHPIPEDVEAQFNNNRNSPKYAFWRWTDKNMTNGKIVYRDKPQWKAYLSHQQRDAWHQDYPRRRYRRPY
jgi:hypothetical protein